MRRNYTVKQQKKRAGHSVVLLGIFIIAFASGISFLQYKYHFINVYLIANYAERARTWMSEHKVHLNANIQKVKQFASNQDEPEQPVHFEFYKTLTSADMTTAEPVVSDVLPVSAKKTDNIAIKPTKSPAALPASIVSASDLENDLSQEVSVDNYVIQAGVFKNASGAEQFKRSLLAIGFTAKVIKMTNADKEIYRVQLGPYNNKTQAKVAQQRLQRKGLQSTIRKI